MKTWSRSLASWCREDPESPAFEAAILPIDNLSNRALFPCLREFETVTQTRGVLEGCITFENSPKPRVFR